MNKIELKCFNRVLLHEKFDRNISAEAIKLNDNKKNKASVEIKIVIGFPKNEKSEFIRKKGRFNIKVMVNITTLGEEKPEIVYSSTYSIGYHVLGDIDITEKYISEKSLIDKDIIKDIMKRVEETLSLSGLKNFSLSDDL